MPILSLRPFSRRPRPDAQPLAQKPAPKRRRPRASSNISLEGMLFIGLALLIGLAAINTGVNLLYLVLSMMLAMLIVSGVLARVNLRRLSLSRRYPLEFHAGETVQGQLEIHNAKRLFYSYALGLGDELSGPAEDQEAPRKKGGATRRGLWRQTLRGFILSAAPRQRVACPVRFSVPRRGLYTLGQMHIVTRFPFGFFEKMWTLDEPGQLLAYPRLLPVVAVLAQCAQPVGGRPRESRGQSAGIFGVREYRPGDSARAIHWKLSAKGQGLMVKEFEQEEERRIRLLLDLRAPERAEPADLEHFEKAVSVTATLARELLRQGATVGLWTSSGNIPLGSGPRHRQRVMRALALVRRQPPGARPVLPDAEGDGAVQVWIEYREETERPPRPALSRHSGASQVVIDARQVDDPGTQPAAQNSGAADAENDED